MSLRRIRARAIRESHALALEVPLVYELDKTEVAEHDARIRVRAVLVRQKHVPRLDVQVTDPDPAMKVLEGSCNTTQNVPDIILLYRLTVQPFPPYHIIEGSCITVLQNQSQARPTEVPHVLDHVIEILSPRNPLQRLQLVDGTLMKATARGHELGNKGLACRVLTDDDDGINHLAALILKKLQSTVSWDLGIAPD